MRTSSERVYDLKVPYWVDIFGTLKEVYWEKKPDVKHRPLTWADRPLSEERIMELFEESGRKPVRFAQLIEQEHGIKEWEVEERKEPE